MPLCMDATLAYVSYYVCGAVGDFRLPSLLLFFKRRQKTAGLVFASFYVVVG